MRLEPAPMAACGALLLALGLQAVTPRAEAPSAPGGLAPRRPALVAAPMTPPYAAVQAHPLFAPDRQPDTAGPAQTAAATALDAYAVLGAAVGGAHATVLIGSPGGEAKTLRPGEVFEGWRLAAVERTQAVFERAGLRRSLTVGAPPENEVRAAAKAAAQPAESE